LRPYTAQQLNLTHRSEKVMVLAALGGRYLGPSLQVHAPTLISRVASTLSRTDVVVFIDDPMPDIATIHVIESMLDEFGSDCGLVRAVPATEAVKRLEDGVVAEGIDRSSLFSPKPPEILRRGCLENIVLGLTDEQWVSPSALVLAAGGTIRTFDDTHLAHLR
jgi:2-C-methyl-D-erythritol 4-phosphate cytidylyltransferase